MSGVRVIFLMCSVWLVGVGGTPRCPPGFHTHGKSCYWFSKNQETFLNARATCEYLRSHLAVIENKAENDFLKAFATDRGRASHYYISGSDIGLNGWWRWEGGRPMKYTDWQPGQPEQNEQHCLLMVKSSLYRWHDEFCHYKHNFICELSL